MGLQSTPAYASVLSHPVELDRNVLRGLFASSGILRFGNFVVAPTATTRQFSISAGRAFMLGVENGQQGGYFAWSDASENLVVGAPSASPRIDTVLLRVWDSQYGTLPSGISRCQWDIIAGTPNASPAVLPDSSFLSAGANYVPGAWLRLCDIRSNPGDTTIPANQIYPSNQFVKLPGGVQWCNSVASTTGFGGRPSSPNAGDRIYELDTKLFYTWNGTKWIRDDRTLQVSSLFTATTTTMADVPGLSFAGEAGAVYPFYSWMHTVAPTANDLAVQWVLPSGATVEWSFLGPASTDAGAEPTTVYQGAITTNGPLTIGGMASSGTVGQLIGTITMGGTPGTCKIQGAQGTAGGSSFIRASSWLSYGQSG